MLSSDSLLKHCTYARRAAKRRVKAGCIPDFMSAEVEGKVLVYGLLRGDGVVLMFD